MDSKSKDTVPASVSVLRQQARDAVSAGNSEKALSLLMQARKSSPKDSDVQFDFGMVALCLKRFEEAREAFQQVLLQKRYDPDAMYGEGRAQVGLEKLPVAREYFETYVRVRPNASGFYALGLVEASLQQNGEARSQFEKSAKLQPQQTESYFQLALLDLRGGDLDHAAARFDRVLQENPNHAGALAGMGRMEFERKNYDGAAKMLERAVQKDPSISEAHQYLGMTYEKLGRKKKSQRELKTASQLEKQQPNRYNQVLMLLTPSDPNGILADLKK